MRIPVGPKCWRSRSPHRQLGKRGCRRRFGRPGEPVGRDVGRGDRHRRLTDHRSGSRACAGRGVGSLTFTPVAAIGRLDRQTAEGLWAILGVADAASRRRVHRRGHLAARTR